MYDFDRNTILMVKDVLDQARERGLMIATAESCTGGLLAAVFTEVPGSSTVFERGFVTYSNEAKMELLGVSADTLAAHGAVSEQTAREMAEGALHRSRADITVAITGIAGPTGGTPAKPVGLVHFASAARDGDTIALMKHFGDVGRPEVRFQAMLTALDLLRLQLEENYPPLHA